ncbi:hypothetical protein [Novosphingobium album (ex Liu et al. 2023)]|uniref:Porin n=1 Tax=Novosphingobium album (ex Liu et al. 2023) TaxID=3031130 RepID=A0ABT5WRR0_9SPHN|nr:hypothetical protein [Novosphingobium album (ex Liu et al. 2023)]MDE8651673.1 hypothetical protein [Novosphingobium album (ex Liu et al. 2023)]
MAFSGKRGPRSGTTAGLLLASAVGLLALPSAVLAFTANFGPTDEQTPKIDPIGPASPPASLARPLALRSFAKGQLFPFTPAGMPNRPDRSITVAVRVDPGAAQTITVRGPVKLAQVDSDSAHLRIAPTAFNLGVSRGYRSFSQDLVQPSGRGVADLPDLRKYTLSPGAKPDSSRFSPRISIDEKQAAGRAPRTFAGEAGEVDVGGAYRVTDNLDVTAGVRYSQDRERLVPLTDGKQDNQAVYVGTQFRF